MFKKFKNLLCWLGLHNWYFISSYEKECKYCGLYKRRICGEWI